MLTLSREGMWPTIRRLLLTIYNDVFDNSSLILTHHHLNAAIRMIPDWWGVILVEDVTDDNHIKFTQLRNPHQNETINNYSVARLLWRKEVQEILTDLGVSGMRLREKRSNLYNYIVEMLNSHDLRFVVREYLKKRQGWRLPL